jgi:hypothetical protein
MRASAIAAAAALLSMMASAQAEGFKPISSAQGRSEGFRIVRPGIETGTEKPAYRPVVRVMIGNGEPTAVGLNSEQGARRGQDNNPTVTNERTESGKGKEDIVTDFDRPAFSTPF